MTEGSVLTFNFCIMKNNYKQHGKYYEYLTEDMINNEILKKNSVYRYFQYFPLVLSLAAVFLVAPYEPFKNEAAIVKIQSLNDSLNSIKTAQVSSNQFILSSEMIPIFRGKINPCRLHQTIKIQQYNQYDSNQI